MLANEILKEAANTIDNRASERDTDTERSMASCVNAFNAMFGTELTEQQGWQFMVLLKMSRAKGGEFKLDDYLDMAAYAALAGESAAEIKPEINFREFVMNGLEISHGNHVSIDDVYTHYCKWCKDHVSKDEFKEALSLFYHVRDGITVLNVIFKNPL